MLFGGGNKNIKIKAVFFILFFLWILMAQGKQGADSLGLWRKAGWNWPLCRPQAIGLCTSFSGLIRSCKFNFHPLKSDRGCCRDNRTQLSLPGRAAQPSPHCCPWSACAMLSRSSWLWKCLKIPFALGRGPCPDHFSPGFEKQTWTTQSLGSAQHKKASDTPSKPGSGWASMKVWTGKALATQEALSHSGKQKGFDF